MPLLISTNVAALGYEAPLASSDKSFDVDLPPLPVTEKDPQPPITDSPGTMKRRKGLSEPLERKPDDLETGKKEVGRSKLDPKMTVNNRLLALEDTIRAMSDVINLHWTPSTGG
jgi:hypothetical protein